MANLSLLIMTWPIRIETTFSSQTTRSWTPWATQWYWANVVFLLHNSLAQARQINGKETTRSDTIVLECSCPWSLEGHILRQLFQLKKHVMVKIKSRHFLWIPNNGEWGKEKERERERERERENERERVRTCARALLGITLDRLKLRAANYMLTEGVCTAPRMKLNLAVLRLSRVQQRRTFSPFPPSKTTLLARKPCHSPTEPTTKELFVLPSTVKHSSSSLLVKARPGSRSVGPNAPMYVNFHLSHRNWSMSQPNWSKTMDQL